MKIHCSRGSFCTICMMASFGMGWCKCCSNVARLIGAPTGAPSDLGEWWWMCPCLLQWDSDPVWRIVAVIARLQESSCSVLHCWAVAVPSWEPLDAVMHGGPVCISGSDDGSILLEASAGDDLQHVSFFVSYLLGPCTQVCMCVRDDCVIIMNWVGFLQYVYYTHVLKLYVSHLAWFTALWRWLVSCDDNYCKLLHSEARSYGS